MTLSLPTTTLIHRNMTTTWNEGNLAVIRVQVLCAMILFEIVSSSARADSFEYSRKQGCTDFKKVKSAGPGT